MQHGQTKTVYKRETVLCTFKKDKVRVLCCIFCDVESSNMVNASSYPFCVSNLI